MSAIVKALVIEYATINARDVVDGLLHEKIDLDRAVDYLARQRLLTDRERKVLLYASYGHNHSSGSRELGVSRWLYKRLLNSACRKIATFLGWEYSDKKLLVWAERNQISKQAAVEALEQYSTY